VTSPKHAEVFSWKPADLLRAGEIPRGYVITRETSDFGVVAFPGKVAAAILKIPAPLACYWLSRSEGRS